MGRKPAHLLRVTAKKLKKGARLVDLAPVKITDNIKMHFGEGFEPETHVSNVNI